MTYTTRQLTANIPEGSTVDTIVEQVRQLLSLRVMMTQLRIVAGTGNQAGMISCDVAVMEDEPELPEPESVWEVLDVAPLRQFTPGEEPRLSLSALRVVAEAMFAVTQQGKAPLAWLIGSVPTFMAWLGLSGDCPSAFLSLPVILLTRVPSDHMILLGGKSRQQSPLKADMGLIISLEVDRASSSKEDAE